MPCGRCAAPISTIVQMAKNLDTLTIEAFGRSLRAGELSSRQVTEHCLQRIAEDNARLNAFTCVLADEARARAEDADRELAAGLDRGPLHGVPVSIKDLIDVRGIPTTAASHVRDGHVASRDATVVAHLRRAGAVLVGKTNLHEFAFGITNEDSSFGPARNPHDVTRSPGGSSGGSAISVAAGMALASVGTDTGGSIRIPAAACGIVGLKPTIGDVSTEGVVPLSRTLDHVGPLARSVLDAWSVYRALRGDHQATALAMPVAHLRLAVLRRYFCDLLDDEVRARFEESLERLRGAGATMVETDLSGAELIASVYMTIGVADAAAYHAPTLDEMPERYSVPVRLRLEAGRYLLAEDYTRALRGRAVLREAVDRMLSDCDALVLPTLPIPAPTLGAQSVTLGGRTESVRNLMIRETQLFNLTGHPAISIPCGTTSLGLPCGIQLAGGRHQTETLLQVGLACERAM
jgi:aspartyl-tRNA(Asn)/glutamyl-tRNA(Gln) amidotransferase subunit A